MAGTETEILVPRDSVSSARKGAIVTVRTSEGREHRARVLGAEGHLVLVRVFERLDLPTESHLHITLIQALPKREKMIFIIQKATELGVNSIQPCISSKSTSTEEAGLAQDKSHRWLHVARKAVEQCRRRTIPVVSPATSFQDAVDAAAGREALKLILYERERRMRLRDVVPEGERPASVILACGPEGGFTESEVAWAQERGFAPVSLGGRVLRCETAALASLAIVQNLWGDL
jgi:16S rRNA (uracil1498-N3)-methyltransferase